jgi:hypothetical protein
MSAFEEYCYNNIKLKDLKREKLDLIIREQEINKEIYDTIEIQKELIREIVVNNK